MLYKHKAGEMADALVWKYCELPKAKCGIADIVVMLWSQAKFVIVTWQGVLTQNPGKQLEEQSRQVYHNVPWCIHILDIKTETGFIDNYLAHHYILITFSSVCLQCLNTLMQ